MSIIIKNLGLQPYLETWQAMQDFTAHRNHDTPDEIWLVQHPATFTQGLNGKAEHILQSSNIPLVQSDRGGQITYHAPGQVIIYVLLDLKRAKLGVRALVTELENSIIHYLSIHDIDAKARKEAPGVYVDGKKVASLGLKIRKQRSYHGLALNVDMDLNPFKLVNPCGLQGMQMTQLRDLTTKPVNVQNVAEELATIIEKRLLSKYLLV